MVRKGEDMKQAFKGLLSSFPIIPLFRYFAIPIFECPNWFI